jgi:hypothetical protein
MRYPRILIHVHIRPNWLLGVNSHLYTQLLLIHCNIFVSYLPLQVVGFELDSFGLE